MYTCKHYTSIEQQPLLEEMYQFIYTLKDELKLNDMNTAKQVVDLCLERGGLIAVYQDALLCGLMGYFWGEPQNDFANQDVAFMYVAGILPEYRRRGVFPTALLYSLEQFKKAGAYEIRLQAEVNNPYTNRLYARFAKPLSRDATLNGRDVMTYGGSIDEALAYVNRFKRPFSPPTANPQTVHHNNHMPHLLFS